MYTIFSVFLFAQRCRSYSVCRVTRLNAIWRLARPLSRSDCAPCFTSCSLHLHMSKVRYRCLPSTSFLLVDLKENLLHGRRSRSHKGRPECRAEAVSIRDGIKYSFPYRNNVSHTDVHSLIDYIGCSNCMSSSLLALIFKLIKKIN